ncbi:CRISPR-associated endonuclease Cas1 [Thermodesulfovibrio sp. 3907-1M]|uniref:CRISPR-associated endonuclease Cas1 n=1 Tax=Thermodesulfovibrio autotrophicus TaxID=3118333 RepID=A0AAU8GVI0_9BACT
MQRTLYLIERGNRINLHADGPSLLITSRNKAARRIPVNAIDKVVVIGNIRIDADSITLCADNNIPLLFISQGNTEKAFILPYNHKLPRHYKEQRIIIQSEDTQRRYRKWIQTRKTMMQMQILREIFKKFRLPDEIGEGNYQFIINKIGQRYATWSMIKDIVENFIRAIILGRILNAGLDPHFGIINRRVNFGLLLDLSLIFEPEADLQTIKFFQSNSVKIENNELSESNIKSIIDRFESRRESIFQLAETVIDEFFEIMKDLRK